MSVSPISTYNFEHGHFEEKVVQPETATVNWWVADKHKAHGKQLNLAVLGGTKTPIMEKPCNCQGLSYYCVCVCVCRHGCLLLAVFGIYLFVFMLFVCPQHILRRIFQVQVWRTSRFWVFGVSVSCSSTAWKLSAHNCRRREKEPSWCGTR